MLQVYGVHSVEREMERTDFVLAVGLAGDRPKV